MSDCKICDNKAGLSILLVRPTALSTESDFAPAQADELKTHAPSVQALGLPAGLQKTRYALRMLRRGGFVYVYYTKRPPQLITPWQAYRVQDSGALIPENQIAWDDQNAVFACNRKPTHPHDVRTLCLRTPNDPGNAGPAWIGFSMNWWDDAMRHQRVQADPSAAGMVRIDPLKELGGVANAFKAEADLIQQHVADFALRSLHHGGVKKGENTTEGGTEPATPFYNQPQDKTYRHQANELVAVMKKQAEGHPLTKGKQFVLALPDPVGLAADLNGIRIAKDKSFKDAVRQSPEGWPTTSHAMLNALQAAMKTAGLARAESEAYGSTSRARWETLRTQPYFQIGYEWEPSPDGSLASDGSPNGRIVEPGNIRRTRGVARRGEWLGDAQWRGIADEIDDAARKEWIDKRNKALGKEADLLYEYERDWLLLTRHQSTLNYFRHHFDEDAPNLLTAPASAGAIYAGESHLIHFPQPLSRQECLREYLAHTLDRPITDAQAIALRAMFGNQKSAIAQAHALLVGDWERSGDNMRDKVYDLIKGLLTTEAGRKFSWLTNVVAAFSISQTMAFTAAATQLVRSPRSAPAIEPYLRKLPKVCLAHHGFEAALKAAGKTGQALDMPVLLELKLGARDAVAILAGKTAAARAVEWVVRAGEGEVRMWALTSLDAIARLRDPGATEAGRAPVRTPSAGGNPLEELKRRAASLDAIQLTPRDATRILNYQNERAIAAARQAGNAEIFKSNTDARLAGGSLIVQGLGMYWGMKALIEAYAGEGPQAEGRRKEAWLSVGDSASGLVAGFLELAHAGNSMRLVGQGGMAAMEASAVLPLLRLGAALAGVGGGVIGMWVSWDRAQEAERRGDDVAHDAYRVAGYSFAGSAFTSGALAVKAGAEAALKRFAERRAVVMVAGAIVGGMEVTVAGVAIATIVSGVGIVLLGAGIVATVIAMHERTPLEKWANRSYFGKGGRGPKFHSGKEELAQFEEALAPPKPEAAAAPAPYPTPAYDPRQRPPGQRSSS